MSLTVDMDDVGRDPPVGGRRVEEPPLRVLGVLDRTDATEGASDFGLVLTTEGGLEPVCVTRGDLVTSVLGMDDAFGVASPITVDRVDVVVTDTELGVSFESGRGPRLRSGLFDGTVAVLLATDLTELAEEFKLCSRCEGVMLRFIVFRLSTLARKDTESASGSTLLSVARRPVRVGKALGGVDGEALIKSSTAISIS